MKIVTPKGSVIQRYPKTGVGKLVGSRLYLHESYISEELFAVLGIPWSVWKRATKFYQKFNDVNWSYNCVQINLKTWDIRLDQAPDFNMAREPHVGKWLMVPFQGRPFNGYSDALWHHKFCWVKPGCQLFDVAASEAWSAKYVPLLAGPPSGSPAVFERQLKAAGLA